MIYDLITCNMKKLLWIVIFSLLFSINAHAYKNIKILDKIDLKLDSDPQTALNSIKNYDSNTICEIRVTKKGDYVPTTVRFSFNDNLSDLYNFFRSYKRPIGISCNKFKYKFINKFNEFSTLDKEIILRLSICKNRLTEIEIIAYLNTKLYGKNPNALMYWKNLFSSYSSNNPRKEIKEYGERNVWVDKIFKDKKSEVLFSIIQSIENNGLASYDVSLVDSKKYSRCYLN